LEREEEKGRKDLKRARERDGEKGERGRDIIDR